MASKATLFERLLPIVFLLLLCTFTASANADHSFDVNPNPSPEASTSLICPNDNPSDCYPALFQPTIHFQKILPNQSLPPGLHVRLNIQTGEKEARLNVPEEADRDKSEAIMIIDDAPHVSETALRVVDEEDSPLHLRLQDAQKQAEQARPYTPPRPAPVNADEAILYDAALATIKQKSLITGANGIIFDSEMAEAFETLMELSHSIEWGLTICRNADFVLPLLKSIFEADASYEPELRSAALLLLATAIQNNPDALRALLHTEEALESGKELVSRTVRSIERDSSLVDESELYTNLVAREIFFLSQICVWEIMTHYYLHVMGHPDGQIEAFSLLWGLFAGAQEMEAKGKMKLKHRIANFVQDHVEDVVVHYLGSYLGGFDSTEVVNIQQMLVYDAFQPWCRALHSDGLKYGKDDSFGFLQAQREVSRALDSYAGKGCVETIDDVSMKEL